MSVGETVKEVRRLEQVTRLLVKYELGHIVTQLKLASGYHKQKAVEPEALVRICEELGGTFVKLGQFLSLRPDLLPKRFSDAFGKLQEDVPPFDGKLAKEMISSELGGPLSKYFSYVHPVPVAAASLGQVHRAKLRSGTNVAVKVLRPGIREQVHIDLLLLYRFAHLISHHFSPKVFDPLRLVEEFRRYSESELSYLGEMQSLKTAAENFKFVPSVVIPKTYDSLCASGVLTMDFVDGVSLRKSLPKLSKERKRRIAKQLVHVLFKQIFIDGFFHADIHPGNVLLVGKDKLALIDFGIVGVLDESTREYLTLLVVSLINKDLDGVIKAMARLHFFHLHEDPVRLKEDLRTALAPFYGVGVDKIDIAALFMQCLQVARDNDMQVPTDLVLLGKSIVTVKGVVQELDPTFDIVDEAKPFMSELLQRKMSLKSLLHKASEEMISLRSFITDLPRMTEEYFDAANRIDDDLKHLGYQLEVFTRDVTLMIRQGIFLLLILVFAAVALLALDIAPFVGGVSLISVVAGFLSLVLVFSFVRSFRRIVV